jgi:hypothetical protein
MTPARQPAGRYSGGVPLFWLSYRHTNGSFAGVVMIESNALVNARMRAALSGADEGLLFVSGHVLDSDNTAQVPSDLIGRLLDRSDLLKLERMLLDKKLSPRSATSAKRVRKPWRNG